MTDGNSVTINNLRDSANGTFVTLDDYLPLTKFEDRSQEETEWQEQGAREAAWKLAKKSVLNSRSTKEQHSCHLRKIGACLYQR